jgi:hypothetical protein
MVTRSKKRVAHEPLPPRLGPARKSARISSKSLQLLASQTSLSKISKSTLTKFTTFSKLPKEIRLKIWKLAASCRIISFKKGGGVAHGVFLACRESHRETRHEFKILKKKNHMHGTQIALYCNYQNDILNITEFRKETWASTAYYVLQSSNYYFKTWMKPVQRLAIGIRIDDYIFHKRYRGQQVEQFFYWDEPWLLLRRLCPGLKELFLVFGGDHSTKLEDMAEVTGPGRNVDEQIIIKNIRQSFEEVKIKGEHVGLQLIFMST